MRSRDQNAHGADIFFSNVLLVHCCGPASLGYPQQLCHTPSKGRQPVYVASCHSLEQQLVLVVTVKTSRIQGFPKWGIGVLALNLPTALPRALRCMDCCLGVGRLAIWLCRGTVNSRYKHTVGTREYRLIANICLYRVKITYLKNNIGNRY